MRTCRLEALDIFRKWSADKSLVRCEGRFSNFAFSSNGRIFSVTDDEMKIMSDDTLSEVVVAFSSEVHFGYADNRAVTGVGKNYDSCLVVFFGPVPDEGIGEPDTISIAALAEGSHEPI